MPSRPAGSRECPPRRCNWAEKTGAPARGETHQLRAAGELKALHRQLGHGEGRAAQGGGAHRFEGPASARPAAAPPAAPAGRLQPTTRPPRAEQPRGHLLHVGGAHALHPLDLVQGLLPVGVHRPLAQLLRQVGHGLALVGFRRAQHRLGALQLGGADAGRAQALELLVQGRLERRRLHALGRTRRRARRRRSRRACRCWPRGWWRAPARTPAGAASARRARRRGWCGSRRARSRRRCPPAWSARPGTGACPRRPSQA